MAKIPFEPVHMSTLQSNEILSQMQSVYNFREPMLRYRWLIYFRQVTGIPEKYAGTKMDLYFEFLNSIIIVPLVLIPDTACVGNPQV